MRSILLVISLLISLASGAQPICKGMFVGAGGGTYNTLSTVWQSYNLGVPRFTITNNGRDYSCAAVNALCSSNIGKNTGKWYWEITTTAGGPTGSYIFGLIVDRSVIISTQTVLLQFINSIGYRGQAGVNCYAYYYSGGSVTTCSALNTAAAGCTACTGGAVGNGITWSLALDCTTGTWRIYKSGVLVSTVVNIPMTSPWYFTIQARTGGSVSGSCNFGQAAFVYGPAALGLTGYPDAANAGGLYE